MNLKNFLVLTSQKNLAGMNIVRELKKISNLPIHIFEEDIVYPENIDKKLSKYDFFIFASTHKSKQHNKTLSVHAIGNWNKAELGGKDKTAVKTSAFFNKYLFTKLNEFAKFLPEYSLTLEATHHGPYIDTPCCFIEIGSTEEEWQDTRAVKVVAETIKSAVESFSFEKSEKELISAIGLGGPHYCPNFNKIQLNSEYALSHIIPGYAFPLTNEIIKEAILKTIERTEIFILDWKGLGKAEERNRYLELLNALGFKAIRSSDVAK